MSLKNKLLRLKPHLSSGTHSEETTASIPKTAPLDIPFQELWEKENVRPYILDQDYCLIREVSYPLTHQHGQYQFNAFLKAIDIWNNTQINHPLSARGNRAEDLFFFDTETTGLGGGVGNTIFLLGYASVSGDQLILRQHILPHPGAEVALYQSFLERVNYQTLVTYNGKSFDWPQVKTRHTLVRNHVPNLPAFGHFDLFHAAKRLWKHKLERLKLAVVEKEVLEVVRHDDIPGFLAPMIYFDFLETKQPDGMIGILKHNETDILSLVTLYAHLTFQLCGADQKQSRSETFEVGRWFSTLGENREAEKVLSRLVDENDEASAKARLTLAFQHKKEKQWEKAHRLFLSLAECIQSEIALEACIELAKIYEHRLRDLQLAEAYCLKAITILEQDGNGHLLKKYPMEQLKVRLNRIIRKYSNIPVT